MSKERRNRSRRSRPKSQRRVLRSMRLHYLEGLSIRAISKRMRIARKTVRRFISTKKKPKPPDA